MEKISVEQIVEENRQLVINLCNKMIRDRDLRKDAQQEVWVEVVKSYPDFRGESKLSTWIYTIAKRTILRLIKNQKVYSTTHFSNYFRDWEEGEIDFPDDRWEKLQFVKEQCNMCMEGILHCLGQESRMKYVMRDINRLHYSEISSIFTKSEASIRKDVSRSREKLKMFLNDECYLYNPQGKCSCRMKSGLKSLNIENEIKSLRETSDSINIYREDFWERVS